MRTIRREILDLAAALPVLAFFAAVCRALGSDWATIGRFIGSILLLFLIAWGAGVYMRRTGKPIPTITGPIPRPPKEPERSPSPFSLPEAGLARVLVLALRVFEVGILTGTALLVVGHLALPVFLPLHVPIAFLVVAGLEGMAQRVTRRQLASGAQQGHNRVAFYDDGPVKPSSS